MKLSKTSAQAALALVVLANHEPGVYLQAREIGVRLQTATVSVLKILQALARHGLIESQLGRAGGYQLARSARQITLLDIVTAIDGPVEGQVRLDQPPAELQTVVNSLLGVCRQSADDTRRLLGQITLASLAQIAPALPLATPLVAPAAPTIMPAQAA